MGAPNVKVKEPVEVKQLKVGGPPKGAKPCLKLSLSGPQSLEEEQEARSRTGGSNLCLTRDPELYSETQKRTIRLCHVYCFN